MKAQRCPICGGTGQVDSGFYTQTSGQWTSAGGFETCRSCWGKGYVLVPDKHGYNFEKHGEALNQIIENQKRRHGN